MNKVWSLCLLFIFTYQFSNSQILFVKEGATGDGSSWQNAKGDLNEALRSATEGTQVWVAKGTYYPVNCEDCPDRLRFISFEISRGVAVYGGFEGTERTLSERDYQKNHSTLSGNIGRADELDNSYSIVKIKNANSKTVLDGFIISDGNANGWYAPGDIACAGGALYNDGSEGSSNPIIKNCHFMYNYGHEGAAIYNYGFGGEASPTLINCNFINNKTLKGGGAIANFGVDGKSSPKITSCKFVGNEASIGGAILNVASGEGISEPFVEESMFINNKAKEGAVLFYLGRSSDMEPKINNSKLLNNTSEGGNDLFYTSEERLPKGLLNDHLTQKG